MENRRILLDKIAIQLNIKTPSDWGKVTWKQFCELGGSTLLNHYYNGSLFACLQSVYKDINWKREWFNRVSNSHWKIENRKNFLDEIAKKLNIKKPSDWGKVRIAKIKELGGSFVLSNYNGSLRQTLRILYPETEWKIEWFEIAPQGHWKHIQNKREFLEKFARKFGIKNPSDWGRISTHQVKENGGKALLKQYKGSLVKCLKSVFPEIQWKMEWFETLPHGYWQDPNNQRNFLENLSKKLEIKTPSDWGKVTVKDFHQNRGNTLLKGNSIIGVLRKNFPEIKWQLEWFSNLPRFSRGHWNSEQNQIEFLDSIAIMYHVSQPNDWKRITASLIRSKGGQGLLNQYNGSLSEALKRVYKGANWSGLSEMNSELTGSKPQKSLERFLKRTFPFDEILTNFRHPGLHHSKSNINVELDIWIPRYRLAFEYHGEQHFRETFNQSLSHQISRDETRRIQCQQLNITLIEVPYWWNGNEEQIIATILQSRPDLEHVIYSPMMKDPKTKSQLLYDPSLAIPKFNQYKDAEYLMLSTNWNPDMNPEGWYIVEKLDGIRGYWDGSRMFSKAGNVIEIPHWFAEALPNQFHLDGEFWSGRLAYPECRRNLVKKDFKEIQYQIFDLPNKKFSYLERQELLNKLLLHQKFPNIQIPVITKCKDREHLMKVLEETIEKGGEGLILRHPKSKYIIGRTEFSLKVKPTYTEMVRVVDLERIEQTNEKLFKYCHLEVENKRGQRFKLNTRTSQIRFPLITKDSVVTIGFSGLNINGVPKFSTVLEHHQDAKWEDVSSYSIKEGTTHRKCYCEGCKKELKQKELRIQVKGATWPKAGTGFEPIYRIFSMCINKNCFEEGIYELRVSGAQFPAFQGKLVVEVNIPEEDMIHLKSFLKIVDKKNTFISDSQLFILKKD